MPVKSRILGLLHDSIAGQKTALQCCRTKRQHYCNAEEQKGAKPLQKSFVPLIPALLQIWDDVTVAKVQIVKTRLFC